MSKNRFRDKGIVRSEVPDYKDYHCYYDYLCKDFNDRCCYCNLPQSLFTQKFHIDHFIPRKIFGGVDDSLDNDYSNLMLACPKCNLAKSDKYEGQKERGRMKNVLFYNPVLEDYNDIFYINEYGMICSNDEKGQNTIKLLKLYRACHSLGRLVDGLTNLADVLTVEIEAESDPQRKKLLKEAYRDVAVEYMKKARLFSLAYRSKFNDTKL